MHLVGNSMDWMFWHAVRSDDRYGGTEGTQLMNDLRREDKAEVTNESLKRRIASCSIL